MNDSNRNALAGDAAQGAENAGFARLPNDSNTGTPPRPQPGTARAAVLDALLAGEHLTSLSAWEKYGASRLAADVYALRRMGWRIIGVDACVACRYGRSSVVKAYSLDRGPRHER
ncbi:helix-turn-helix domain-containing protein [Luteimonas sp. A478]